MIGIGAVALLLLILLPLLPAVGFIGLLAGTAAEVQENGPQVPPELEAAYRQVAADTGRDWTVLAAWDGADNRFGLPIESEGQILTELIAQEEQRRRQTADRYCRTLPPHSVCPPPRELTEIDVQRLQREAHRIWFAGVLNYIQGHADQVTVVDAADPEALFARVLPAAKAERAAELQLGYTVMQDLAEDDHLIDAPADGGLPPDWHPVDGFTWPATGPITSRFGMRTSPIDGVRRLHAGLDLGIPTGTPIRASKDGTVVRAGWDTVYGNVVFVDHGDGYETVYAHNSELLVAAGARVVQGTMLSRSGSTGYSTGPHLHFEIRFHSVPVDPLLLLGR